MSESGHEGTVQRAGARDASVGTVPPSVYEVLRSAGQPLDSRTRTFLKPTPRAGSQRSPDSQRHLCGAVG